MDDYIEHTALSIWEVVERYSIAGYEVYVINGHDKDTGLIKRDGYFYREFKVDIKSNLSTKIGRMLSRLEREKILNRKFEDLSKEILDKNKDEAIVIYGYEVHATEVAKRLAEEYGALFVSRFQGTILCNEKDSLFNHIRFYPHFKSLKQKADAIVMTNDGTKGEETLRRLGNKTEKILFFRNGVDKPSENGTVPESIKRLVGEKRILMTLSRLEPWKRIERALYSMPGIIKEIPNAHLVICGTGSAEATLHQITSELKLDEHVTFAGLIKHDDVFACIECADIFLSLYDLSNLGNPLMEALRCGKPIITLDVGDTKTVIDGENGIILPVEDVDKVSEWAIKLLKDKDLADKYSKNAFKYAEKNLWTWEERMKAEIDVINDLLDKKIGRSH